MVCFTGFFVARHEFGHGFFVGCASLCVDVVCAFSFFFHVVDEVLNFFHRVFVFIDAGIFDQLFD